MINVIGIIMICDNIFKFISKGIILKNNSVDIQQCKGFLACTPKAVSLNNPYVIN